MENARLTFLFHRYVSGTASETEKKELLKFLSDSESEPQAKVLLEELWRGVPEGKLPAENADRIFQNILLAEKAQSSPRSPFLVFKIAAALLMTVLSLAAIYYFIRLDTRSGYALETNSQGQLTPRFLKLTDGSTVILNEGSSLDYPASFADNIREVSLSGEGYFDIASDPSRPFIVHTGKLKTTVLGTAFNIRAYPDQKNITVTVKRGLVQLSDETNVIGVIHPNQQIIFDMQQGHSAKATVDTESVTKWMERDIFFDDITFGQAIEQLERRFGSSIKMESAPLLACRFTATFVKGEDLRQILTILCEFNNATLKEDRSGEFVIEGGECPS